MLMGVLFENVLYLSIFILCVSFYFFVDVFANWSTL